MNEEQIRKLVRDEIQKKSLGGRFGIEPISRHVHNGQDSPNIAARDVTLSSRALGNITMAQASTYYNLQLTTNFDPAMVLFYGGAIHNSNIRSTVQGSALLNGALYFQPSTTTSVITGGLGGLIVQSSTSFTIDSTGATPVCHFVPSEEHIINVATPTATDIVARATVTDYSTNGITVYVSTLAAGWSIIGSWVIL